MLEKDGEILQLEIDFGQLRNGELNESWLAMFGSTVKMILRSMFGEGVVPVQVRGKRREVAAFGKAISKEAKYLKSVKRHGLDNPRTFRSKFRLEKAIDNFEKETGLKWPIK